MDWGGGRKRLGDPIDYGVGLEIQARLGQEVAVGDPLVTAWYNDPSLVDQMETRLAAAWKIAESPRPVPPLIREVM